MNLFPHLLPHPSPTTFDLIVFIIGTAGGGISREDFIDGVAQDILNKIPTVFNIHQIRQKFYSKMTPIIIVLIQELERFNKLLTNMSKILSLLRKVNYIQNCFIVIF